MANSIRRDAATAFRFEGMAEVLRNVSNVIDKTTGQKVKRVYMDAGLRLRDAAKANAPVKSGRLRKSVFAAYGDPAKANVLVGVNYKIAPHAHLVEYGTVNAPPHPFLRPAITQTKSEIRDIISSGLKKIIDEAANGH